MSKILAALEKASEERARLKTIMTDGENKDINAITKENKMRKSWITWVFVAAAVVMVLVMFNRQSGKDDVPLSEIFPDEEVMPVDVEYEFVQEEAVKSEKTAITAVAETKPGAPAVVVNSQPAESAPVKEITLQETKANYTVQIASFKDRKKAEEGLIKIRKNVPSAYLSAQDLGDKGVWYRIYAGQFNLRSDAEVTLSDIKRNYNDSFIIAPKISK